MTKKISIKNARVHNLKNVSLDIPRNKLVVITGLSGSGKSSLAFDTIYAEGQRRYVESLSSYARQFLGLMDKPDVDQIDGLSPAISIDQKNTSNNPRSTVGTVTEVYDYLRLLFARIGIPHCPSCGQEVTKQTKEQIIEKILEIKNDTKVMIISPLIRDKKGEHRSIFLESQKSGYVRTRVDSILYTIDEALELKLDKNKKHSIDIVIDRLMIDETIRKDKTRLAESVEAALELSNGLVVINDTLKDHDHLYSENFVCPKCDISLSEIEPRNFSFNSPHGACPNCSGLGTKLEIDAYLIIPNTSLSIVEGAIRPWSRTASSQTWQIRILEEVSKKNKFSITTPIKKLSKKALDIVLYGTGETTYDVNNNFSSGKVKSFYATYEGVIPNLERRYRETESDYIRTEIEKYMRSYQCPDCHGKRLKPEILSVTIDEQNVSEVTSLTISEALEYINNFTPKNKTQEKIAGQIIKEIKVRLTFLINVGLAYLTLDRSANTLSGGESQRIKLATQIGSSLTGVIYILDEPSIGLHQRDIQKLIKTLIKLRDLDNTVIVVEHDEETMMAADYLIDIGPGAGIHGGEVIAAGTPEEIKKDKKSITGKYLSGKSIISPPKKYREGNGKTITIKGATQHNLKNIDVEIPLGKLVAVTGVSGSGKSTLITDILSKALSFHFFNSKDMPGEHKKVTGLSNLDKVISIDQSPIGRTPRSNPATYTGVFTHIRDLFTQLPEAKMRGYKAGRFSFNVKGGRCENCQGDGMNKIEMHFLPDVYVECDECHGKRFNPQVLDIHYKGQNISDILNMTVNQALSFFSNIPAIHQKLETLEQVGLGYIKLGQSATTLSGGEAQRVKLATELSKRATGKTLYVLDEPTTGLHFEDIKKLLNVLNRLTDKGNSVLIIEHQLDVIKSADWIIDLGPDGGDKGGELVATGTPKDVAKVKASYTGRYLKKVL